VVVTPDPDPEWVEGLLLMRARGLSPIAVVVDAGSYGSGSETSAVVEALQTAGITHYVQRYGRPIAESLHGDTNVTFRFVPGAPIVDFAAATS